MTRRRSRSDGGLLLVRQLEEQLGLTTALAAALPDERQAGEVSQSRQEQLRQRVHQTAAGHEDCNDADSLRHVPLFKTVCERLPQDRGLSSQPMFGGFRYAAETWPRRRRVVVKAEHLPDLCRSRRATRPGARIADCWMSATLDALSTPGAVRPKRDYHPLKVRRPQAKRVIWGW